jgi:membrane-bound lytic murein transglycosylase D
MKLLFILLLTSSCATRLKRYPEQNYGEIKNTPDRHIAEFKTEVTRKELDHVIVHEAPINKSKFLQPVTNKTVQFWIDYYSKNFKGKLAHHLERGFLYKETIEEIYEKHGLPKELFYVGLIESGYSLSAKSRAAAVGPWQFLSSTGQRYGLNITAGVDERRSIIKSTEAAAHFFKDLYNIFGSWELALSGYNAGEWGVIRRIRTAKTRDYYELCEQKVLPAETRNYVPKVLAVMEIIHNPKKYAINLPKPSPSLIAHTKTINVDYSVSLQALASKTGVSVHNLKELNTDLLIYRTPNLRKKTYQLIVPTNATANIPSQTLAAIAKKEIPQVQSSSQVHVVKRGENLTLIARKYQTSQKSLMVKNNITNPSKIFIGQKLKIDGVEKYVVKKGDFLLKIAQKHGTTTTEIKKLNDLNKSTIYPGQQLIVSRN